MKILIVVITELKYIGSGNNFNKDNDDADVNVDVNVDDLGSYALKAEGWWLSLYQDCI